MAQSATATPSKGWQGAVLALFGADDFTLTVIGSEVVTDHYVRIGFDAGGLLATTAVHPTMWVRLWFADEGKLHQRGYTLVDVDPQPTPSSSSSPSTTAPRRGGRRVLRWATRSRPR